MKFSLSGSRTLAVSIIAGTFGWAFGGNDSAMLARYQKMSKDAIVADLTSKQTSMPMSLTASLLIVLGIVVAVDILTSVFDALGRRIGAAPDGSAPPTT